jgi:hypothetical protein
MSVGIEMAIGTPDRICPDVHVQFAAVRCKHFVPGLEVPAFYIRHRPVGEFAEVRLAEVKITCRPFAQPSAALTVRFDFVCTSCGSMPARPA